MRVSRYVSNGVVVGLNGLHREGSPYLLTLHVATETRFSLRKRLKDIMHGIFKMYMMR